jgi:beta-mannosidase
MDCFLPNVTKEKYQKIIKDVKESNMNMLRVWGGGVYENDEFYNQCDENGILVWQDFMFACAMNPGDSIFLSNVKQEATDNIKRLQNHPCIALWCGNNEVDEGWQNWGWQKEFNYTGKDSAFIREDYLKLFNDIIPECLNLKGRENKIVTDIPGEDYPYNFFRDNKYFCRNYIPSSPKIGWGHPEAMKEGDSHYWGVWWGMEPFEVLEKKVPRFMSEFGFQAFPDITAIEKFTFPEDRFLYSDALKSHQKHPVGFETIQKYMERDFVIPNDFNEYIKTSQSLQAYGIKKAIEAQRRAKQYCMGTLFWQLNDCWPGVTWSAIDYYGNKKLLQSVIPKFYDKILISPTIEYSLLKVFIISDKLAKTDGALYLNLKNAISGETVYYKEIKNEIPENSSKIYFQTDLNSLLGNMNKDELILECKYISSDNSEEYDNNLIFVKPKEYKGVLK